MPLGTCPKAPAPLSPGRYLRGVAKGNVGFRDSRTRSQEITVEYIFGGVGVKFDIVRRQFAKVEDKWVEANDLQRRGVTAERTWSSFCVFIPAELADVLTSTLRAQVPARHVDVVPSLSEGGVWLMGAYYQLQNVLPQLRL